MSATRASSATLERVSEQNIEQNTEQTTEASTRASTRATAQALSPLPADSVAGSVAGSLANSVVDSVTEAFVVWAPAKRVIRKQLIAPDGKPQSGPPQVEPTEDQVNQTPSRQVSALMRALGLAHYWQRLLIDRRMTSVKEIAKAEGMSVAQVNRVLRLTLLAPSIIEWLIRSNDVVLEDVMNRPWPSCWATQMRSVCVTDKRRGGQPGQATNQETNI